MKYGEPLATYSEPTISNGGILSPLVDIQVPSTVAVCVIFLLLAVSCTCLIRGSNRVLYNSIIAFCVTLAFVLLGDIFNYPVAPALAVITFYVIRLELYLTRRLKGE